MTDLHEPNVGLDRRTGRVVTGWDHVVHCLEDVFTTRFGERVMREWYGSMVPALLGESLTANDVLRVFSAIGTALEQWEPRYRVVRITPRSVGRDGRLDLVIEGEYRPRALLGDFTVEGARRLSVRAGRTGAVDLSTE